MSPALLTTWPTPPGPLFNPRPLPTAPPTGPATHCQTLAAGQCAVWEVQQPTYVLLVPLSGTVLVQAPQAEANFLVEEEVQVLTIAVPGVLYFSNPHSDAPARFAHIWLPIGAHRPACDAQAFGFTTEVIRHRLTPVVLAVELPFIVSLGWVGARPVAYAPLRPHAQLWAGALTGTVPGLPGPGAGLARWATPALGLMARAEEALVVVLETRPLSSMRPAAGAPATL